MKTSSHSHPLRALVDTILIGIETLEAVHAMHGVPLPSLDKPHTPTALDSDACIAGATHLIVTAAAQLIASARRPIETLQSYALSMFITTSLGFAVEANVADILKGAGTRGLHTKEIAAVNGVHAVRMARVLRHLAAHNVFKEVAPNVFANNRISSLLAKVKSLEDIKADPLSQYEGSGGVAWIAHTADVSLKSSTALSTFLINPCGMNAPFNIAMDENGTIWEWFKKPENLMCGQRFTEAMKGAAAHYPPELYTTAIGWNDLQPDEVVVDIGGGVGNVTFILAQAFPHLRYVVQDLEKNTPEAKKFWADTSPQHICSGQVNIQAHDFFHPQPVRAAAVYFLRFIVHDWPDMENVKILKNIRDAASPSSKLVLFDIVISHACRKKPSPFAGTSSSEQLPSIEILPPGVDWATAIDMQMLNLFNARERTLNEFIELGKASGWKFDLLKHGNPLSAIVFSPA
ncbi:S-adenosyl-L-methionine-dependent methyltransferase [Lyophyllum atratum]|nr:S-adenosyl-L-methionine-dependent methyltransferase [Lyophyllum atratum]